MPHGEQNDVAQRFLDNAKDEEDRQLRIMILRQRTDSNDDIPEEDEMEDDEIKKRSKNQFVFGQDFPENPLRNIEVPPNTMV